MREGSRIQFSSLRHPLLMAWLAALLLLTSGCVFLRLKAFREQLSNFAETCEFSLVHGVHVTFKEPLLYLKDLVWLIGLDPSTTEGEEDDARVTYYVRKLYPDAKKNEQGDFDISANLQFEKKKMKKISFPASFDVVFNEDVINHMVKGLGKGSVNQKDTSTTWSVPDSEILPSIDEVLKVAGKPFKRTEEEKELILEYRWHLDGNGDAEDVHVHALIGYALPKKGFRWSKVKVGRVNFSMEMQESGKQKGKFKAQLNRSFL